MVKNCIPHLSGGAAGFGHTGQLIGVAQAPTGLGHIRRVDVAEMAGHFGANFGGFIKEAEAARQAGDEGVGNKKRAPPDIGTRLVKNCIPHLSGGAAGFGHTGQLIDVTQAPARFDHIRRVDVAEVAGYFGANPGGFIKKAEAARQAGDEGVGNKKRGWPG